MAGKLSITFTEKDARGCFSQLFPTLSLLWSLGLPAYSTSLAAMHSRAPSLDAAQNTQLALACSMLAASCRKQAALLRALAFSCSAVGALLILFILVESALYLSSIHGPGLLTSASLCLLGLSLCAALSAKASRSRAALSLRLSASSGHFAKISESQGGLAAVASSVERIALADLVLGKKASQAARARSSRL